MAATSLAEQLRKLNVPQSSIYSEGKKKASLLFAPEEAALKDRHKFYEIGISGLQELIALYEGFRLYEDTLFSPSSKDFERAIQSKEVNQNLDQTIEKFLLQLSPYFLLESSHKALEWLVNRYHIHEYNQDAIMALILPYHETKIFIRVVQILNLKQMERWKWLMPIQKNGVLLPKQEMYNRCVSHSETLQFIANMTKKYVNEYGERASQLNTVFAFFCSTSIGALNSGKVTEAMMNALLPTLIEGLESSIVDFRSSAFVVIGFLSTKAAIKERTLEIILDKILSSEFGLSYDMTLLINLLFTNQTHVTKLSLSDTILNDISLDVMTQLCLNLKKLVEQKISIFPFTMAFFSSIMPLIFEDNEEFRRFSQLVELFIEEVDLKTQQPEKIIKKILNAYLKTDKSKIPDDNESDIEIVSEEGDFANTILTWYSSLLKNIETKYPDVFDQAIKKEMTTNKSTSARRKMLSKVLGFKPAVAHKIGGSYLFENLNHVNPEKRVEAVKYIVKKFELLKAENIEFVKESIVNRLHDDNLAVVAAALKMPVKYLKEILNEDDLTRGLVKILSQRSKKWKPVISEAILKFCSLDTLPVNQETVLALVPYLFPDDEVSAELTWNIIKSPWGKKFKFTHTLKGINESYRDNAEVLSHIVFKAIFEDKNASFDDILDVLRLNKENTLDVCIYLLLKTCSFKSASTQNLTDVLNLLLESVENRVIVPSADGHSFSKDIMTEFVKLARQDKMLFETMEYMFSRIIEDMNVKEISKPWCNVCETPETVLIRRLYEICVTGCSIPTYGESYSKLLQKLLKKFFSTPKEKFDFIASVACGHILYAADPKDVISPELQLRSMKLLINFIAVQDQATWLYDSDVVLLMVLFNLNNPVTPIRQCTVDFVNALLWEDHDKKMIYPQLLREILAHKEELLLDHEQILHILNTILTQKTPGRKTFKDNCFKKISEILSGATPTYIKSSFMKLLCNFNNTSSFPIILSSLNGVEKMLTESDPDTKLALNIYESNLMKMAYSHINDTTASIFAAESVWKSIETGLKEYRECVMEDDLTFTSPSVLILKQINEDVFKNIPEERTKDVVKLIASAGAFGNNPTISSAAAKVMRKINIIFSDFKDLLEGMLNVEDPTSTTKKKKSTVSLLSYQLSETDPWKLGVALLEYLQSKKRLTVNNSFVVILFQLLKKCLRFEDQSYVEYTKQLILSSLWYYCKKFVDDSDKDQLKNLRSVFDVELVVQCIRGTQNPQTHHHALILLSHAAYMLPEQVLHHTMEIFTFMGSSVLRHDDAYSFQIIIKIIETLIPILVKLDKNAEQYSEKQLQKLQGRVVPVLRIFADSVLHVPEHRRLPLFKKLIETLGPSQFLWVFLGLLLETHMAHHQPESKKQDRNKRRHLAEQESPINRLDFGQNLLLDFPPDVGLENFTKLINHVKTLPLQKDKNSMDTDVDPSEIFSVNGHTAVQLRHYRYVIITFINSCLSSSRFIQHCNQAADIKVMEGHYKTLIVNILTFIQSISKVKDDRVSYWKVMLHHCYDLLDYTNSLLSPPMFVAVIRGLLKHTLVNVQRKSMELLNSKIQFSPEMFDKVDKELLYTLIPALVNIVKTIESKDVNGGELANQELELNQQTALLSLKLLTRMLASEDHKPFEPVLETITEYTCNPSISGPVMASIVLTLAELCSNLKVHALTSLRKFMPALTKLLRKQRKVDAADVVLLSTVTAVTKIVESLPLFLSPYLQTILFEYSILLAQWQNQNQECSKVSAIITKLMNIKKKVASSVPPRVLIPVANETHQLLLEKEKFDAIGPVMSVLAESFGNLTTADFTALQQDLTSFFLSALQLRSDAAEKKVDAAVIDKAEDEVVNALVCLVLKLSETSFRPFYFKIYDWAIRTNVEGHKDRTITFYRLSAAIADKLKGLFVLFAGHFIKNAADLLDSCNSSKNEELFFSSDEKCITLVNYIINTLHIVFLYDSQNFINKDRFETLMQPIVDQLENTLGGISSLKTRAKESLIPCISQFAMAIADDSLWKLLNYQILLKIRHNDAEIRLTALDCLVAMATQLGTSWLPLLAESVPFLAELLEDGDQRIEAATKDAIRQLEQILGEPLEKYF